MSAAASQTRIRSGRREYIPVGCGGDVLSPTLPSEPSFASLPPTPSVEVQ
jgi:hypothetical protein